MKRVIIILTGLLLLAGAVYADNLNLEKKAGDVTVKVTLESNPLKVSDNNISIELLDPEGHAITNAEVAVYYFMPSMPAMNYEVKALPEGGQYTAVIKPTMPGEWTADINAGIGGKEADKVSISFDAR
jgi:nitrogen fixation protein FixH